jgi:hypothetical protein
MNYELRMITLPKNNKICLTTCVKPETLKRMTYEGVLKKMQTEFEINSILFSFRK